MPVLQPMVRDLNSCGGNLRRNIRVDVCSKPTVEPTKPTRSCICAGQKPTREPTETYAASPAETYVFPLLFRKGERRKLRDLINKYVAQTLTLKGPDMPNSPAVAGFVYAIHSPENPRHVKLGLSSNPDARLRALQTGNPYKLKLIWTFPCPNMAELEDRFHKVFDKYRISGSEWFDLRPIDDPDHVWAFLTILAYKYLAENQPAEIRKRLANFEEFIGSPARFLNSQADADAMLDAQFPDRHKYEDDPKGLEAYITRNLKRD